MPHGVPFWKGGASHQRRKYPAKHPHCMGFPLADWINRHEGLPHNLSQSGMKYSLQRSLKRLRPRNGSTLEELQRAFAETLGIDPRRVFLTHGATEANAVTLWFLALELRKKWGRTPRAHVPALEYPPLQEGPGWSGFRRVPDPTASDLHVHSNPNNPRGTLVPHPATSRKGPLFLIDETFREFTPLRSAAIPGNSSIFVTGTLTKAYGADALRVGWVAIPPEWVDRFEPFHGNMVALIPQASLDGAMALLARRQRIFQESREIFRRNERVLRRMLPGIPSLSAPVCFDEISRTPGEGDRLARWAVEKGVLVSPGGLFGDSRGVRICLTQRTFSADLARYIALRREFLEGVHGFRKGAFPAGSNLS